jgi:hypothetical protein
MHGYDIKDATSVVAAIYDRGRQENRARCSIRTLFV